MRSDNMFQGDERPSSANGTHTGDSLMTDYPEIEPRYGIRVDQYRGRAPTNEWLWRKGGVRLNV
jgi:hypothetical protein